MWYKTSVRDELIEKIMDKIPSSIRKEENVEKYVHDYVYKLELGKVKPGNERLVESAIEEVNMKISQNKKK